MKITRAVTPIINGKRVLYPGISTWNKFSLINKVDGTLIAAMIDPRETYRETKTTKAKIPTAISISIVIKVKSIPSAVAIPFPPLKSCKDCPDVSNHC